MTLEVVHRDQWEWHCHNPEQLDEWFSDRMQLAELNEVKSNPVRKVYKVDDSYFVKEEHPSGFGSKLKAGISCKAKREFEAAASLEAAGIPCVRYLGWGRKGTSSMLFTEAFTNAISADDYYWDTLFYNAGKREEFLLLLTDFLKRFYNAGFDHPDLHLGNLMMRPETMELKLVDVYGIHKKRLKKNRFAARLTPLLSSLCDWLTPDRAANIIKELGITTDLEKAHSIWIKMLKDNSKRSLRQYEKRLKRLKRGTSKHLYVNSDENCFYRRTVIPFDYDELLKAPDKYLVPEEMKFETGEKLQALSLKLRMMHLNHLQPLLLTNQTVYFDKLPESAGKVSANELENFSMLCRICGIPVPANDNIFTHNGMVFIKNIRRII